MTKILIVDDDKHARTLLKTIFEQDPAFAAFELEVLTAADGEEGLAVADEHRPQVVVTDLLMPRMDGFRFCEALRQRDHGKAAALFVASGVYRDTHVQQRVRNEYGGTLFTKPYQVKELAEAVARSLGATAPAAGAAPTVALQPPPAAAEVGALSGEFAAVPLPRILLDLYEQRATGTLSLRRGRVEKRIDLVVGHPVAVSSNQRAETLGQFLVSKRIITPAQHEQALARAQDEGEKIGEALVELGVLSAGQLVKQLTAQARLKLTTALRWGNGVWSYRPNRELLERAKGNALDPVAVIFLGLRQTGHYDEAVRALEAYGRGEVALRPRATKLCGAIARAFGEEILVALERPRRVDEILGGERELVPALEALILSGCAEVAGVRPASSPPVAALAEDPLGLEGLSAAARQAADPAPGPGPMAAGPAAASTPPADPSASLYDQLFGEEPSRVDAVPFLELEAPASDGVPVAPLSTEDSGVVEIGLYGSGPVAVVAAPAPADVEREEAREALLAEYLRLQGKDWYGVLEVERSADAAAIQDAYDVHGRTFAIERYAAWDLGRDYAKLEEVHAAYRRALEVLGDSELRATYDHQLDRTGAPPTHEAFSAEIAFHQGEKRLTAGDLDGAVERFEVAARQMPDVADYHAALGWALHRRGRAAGARPGDGDEGVAQLLQALGIDPDHAVVHEYLGRALADRGSDDAQAAVHLERALAADPPRLDALEPLGALRTRRGEHAALERRYRMLLHRLGGADRALALRLWMALGAVYRDGLGDVDAARTAYGCAARLAPDDPDVLRALDELTAGKPGAFADRAAILRARARLAPEDPAPLAELARAAQEAEAWDAAWVTAAALEARGLAGDELRPFYRRYRPRFLVRAQRALDSELWPRVRHPEDDPDVGGLFALLDPLVAANAPMTLADLEVREEDAVADPDLPEPFARVRAWVAGMLSVPAPRVYRRADFGDQIHVGAPAEPVLLAGPAALASADRVALAFELARAMTYLWPGRAVGGSRPSRVLKGLLLSSMSLAVPGLALEDPDGRVAASRAWLAAAPPELQHRIRVAVGRITRDRGAVNLSRWARALARSAERVGLALCGDPAVAARAAATLGSPVDELLEWAVSEDHLAIRAALGISVDV